MCRPALFAPNFWLLLLVFTLHHLKRIQSFLSFNRYLITCSALATHCDHNSGLIYQVMEIRTQIFGQSKWITDLVSIVQHWQRSELSTLSQPTAPAGGNSHLHYITYSAVALILLPSCNWYPYRRTDDKGTGTSILSLGSVVGNENKSKTFPQKHSCSVDTLSFVVSSLFYLAFYTKNTSSASTKCVHWCQK